MKSKSLYITLIFVMYNVFSCSNLNSPKDDFLIFNGFSLRMHEEEFQKILNQKISSGSFGLYNYTPRPLIFNETDTVYGITLKKIKVNPKSGLANRTWGFNPYFHNDSLISVEMFTENESVPFKSLVDSLEKQYGIKSQIITSDSIKLQPKLNFEILFYRNSDHIFIDFHDIRRMNERDSIASLSQGLVQWNEWGDSWDRNNISNFKNQLVNRHIKVENDK